MNKNLLNQFSQAIGNLDQDGAVKLLDCLIERIGDKPEPLMKYRLVIEALLLNAAKEIEKISIMPDDDIKSFATQMMKALSKDLETALKRTY